jgi:hypothetical protein
MIFVLLLSLLVRNRLPRWPYCREIKVGMERLFQDVKYAVRTLSRDRGFTVTATLTLAICLAANVAIFAIVHSVLLQQLPVQAQQLVYMVDAYSGPKTRFYTMVGVVGSVQMRALTEKSATGAYYFPIAQDAIRTMTLLRATCDSRSLQA